MPEIKSLPYPLLQDLFKAGGRGMANREKTAALRLPYKNTRTQYVQRI